MGACMLVRREAIEQVGLLDEAFFLFSEETDWAYRFRERGWKVLFFPGAECVHVGGASHGGRLFRENVRGHLRFLSKHRGEPTRSARAGSCAWRRGCAARSSTATAAGCTARRRTGSPRRGCRSCSSDDARPARVRERGAAAAGRARGAGARGARRGGDAGLVAGAALRCAGGDLPRRRVADADARAAARRRRGRAPVRAACAPRPERIPRWWWVAGAGALLGLLLWHVAGEIGGDGLFHLARVRKLDAFDSLSLDAVNEFADGGLHPGYAFPLWHGFLALVAAGRLPRSRRRRPPRGDGAGAGRAARRLRGGLGALPARRASRRPSSAARSR